jgi:hypothetical protein
MADDDESFKVVDSSGLTDADWAEISKLKRAHESGGRRALSEALEKLRKADPTRYVMVMAAFIPDAVRETIKDDMAERGITEEDVQELVSKHEGSARKH